MTLPYEFQSVQGPRVRLDPLRDDDDFEALYALHSDPEVCRYLLFEPRTRERVREVLTRDAGATRLAEAGDYLQPAVRDASGQLMGTMYLKLVSLQDRSAEIGWLIGPRHQGQGYAREAAALLLDLAFGDLGMHRVGAELDPRNDASVALCGRLGLRREAHFREHMWFKGAWADTGVYAILEQEWRALRSQPA